MTATAAARPVPRTWQLNSEALAIMGKFPPRPVPPAWAATSQARAAVVRRMLSPPFLVCDYKARHVRKLTLLKVLDWLELHPGKTWQERWDATGAGVDGRLDWRARLMADLHASGSLGPQGGHIGSVLGTGLIQLIAGDVLRPGLPWLLATASPVRMAEEMTRVRDPEGIAELKALRKASVVAGSTFLPAVERIALIMAAKGGGVRDITPGDCLELLKHCREVFTGGGQANRHSPFFYQLLHTAGVFPASAPSTVRIFSARFPGQLTPGQLVDRYDLACRPVRDLLVDYLRERQPGVDYNTLTGLASALALRFWKDLETHHPGISSLRLAPDIAAAWKQRIQTRTVRSPGSPGQVIESATARKSADGILTTVRAFYLDLAQWALDEPSRWGPWAVPCPIRAGDIQHKKEKTRRKARMDQRTRRLLPLLPAVTQAVSRAREAAATRLQAAIAAQPGELFTAGSQTLSRARMSRYSPRIWAEEPGTGKRRDLTREEDNAFWAWAAVEVLRATGIFSPGHPLRRKPISAFAQLRG